MQYRENFRLLPDSVALVTELVISESKPKLKRTELQKQMIDYKDIDGIDQSYFEITGKKEYGVEIQSRCTGHYWYLLEQEYNGHKSYQIYHRHHAPNPYHLQKNRPTVEDCCEYIRSHDAYHLQKMKRKEERRQKRFY